MAEPLLHVEGLTKAFASGGRYVKALDEVSLTLSAGETLGIVGASGSGKSTLSRVLLRLIEPDAGRIGFEGKDWLAHKGSDLRRRRARMQMVFQDTLGAFNPHVTAGEAIAEPLRIHRLVPKNERSDEVCRLLERVGLTADHAAHPVRALSGGQRQRVAIARAIASRPALLVLDEAVSALDPTVRERILGLLVALQQETQVASVFISHDLAVVRAVSHRIAVMEAGRIVETGLADDVVQRPQTPVARALISAVPRLRKGSKEAVS